MKKVVSLLGLLILTFNFVLAGQRTSQEIARPEIYRHYSIDRTISYQGNLKDNTGNPVGDGNYNLTFRIYNSAAGGALLWTSPLTLVATSDGYFSTVLTSVFLPFDTTYYLSIQIQGDSEMSQRQRLTLSPYSAVSDTANYAFRADTATYALSSGGGGGSRWTLIGSVLSTNDYWGIAKGNAGNAMFGDSVHTMVNFGVACTTGASGSNNAYSAISSGYHNVAMDTASYIAGGTDNRITAKRGCIGGGRANLVTDEYGVIAGGEQNTVSVYNSFIGGGFGNSAGGGTSVVCGGVFNIAGDSRATVGGGRSNEASGPYSVIAGGGWNTASGFQGTICGGRYNVAGDTAFVGGGSYNNASGIISSIAGGNQNTAPGTFSVIGGGTLNTANGESSTIGGGYNNLTIGRYSTIAGGYIDTASGDYGSVGGGWANTASGNYTTISGGKFNTARGQSSIIGGGNGQLTDGNYSSIPGGGWDTIGTGGNYSMLFGFGVYLNTSYRVAFFDGGTYGRLGINRDDHDGGIGYPIHIGTSTSNGNGAYLTNGGVWTNGSSRTFKENFTPIDGNELLSKISNLSITSYNYKGTSEKHIGPVAEEFVGAFDTGVIRETDGKRDDMYLSSGDVAGVALAGVQELIEQNRQMKKMIDDLRNEIIVLKAKSK